MTSVVSSFIVYTAISKASAPQKALRKLADPAVAASTKRFIKTGKGEYGEGDKFLGVRVPVIRSVAKTYKDVPLSSVITILHSPYHEERQLALLMMVNLFRKSNNNDDDPKSTNESDDIFNAYLNNTPYINGWDLVDTSAYQIVGQYLLRRKHRRSSVLDTLAHSPLLWDKRVAIVSTFAFIRNHEYHDTLRISLLLLREDHQKQHDLIRKAVGWMLREVGNRNKKLELEFLDKHYKIMPRTMLRYAVEKFTPTERRHYLSN